MGRSGGRGHNGERREIGEQRRHGVGRLKYRRYVKSTLSMGFIGDFFSCPPMLDQMGLIRREDCIFTGSGMN